MELLNFPTSLDCPECGAPCPNSVRNCPTCDNDIGYPNIRYAEFESNYLNEKYEDILQKFCNNKDSLENQQKLFDIIKTEAQVVIAVPENYAKSFLINKTSLYTNYEKLIKSDVRTPSPFKDDSDRYAVGGKIFGNFAEEIIYGALSLNKMSLYSYGDVFFILKNVSIEKRTSFLIENSYHFVDNYCNKIRDPLPKGYRSTWKNKEQLVILKLSEKLNPLFDAEQCKNLLVFQGKDREKDDCIEAHIYGNFNLYAIDRISFSQKITKKQKRIIKSLAEQHKIEVV